MRGKGWALVGLLSVILGAGLTWGADISEAHRADIERLMLATGSANLGKQMAFAVSEQFVSAVTKVSPDFSPRAIEITTEVMEEHFEREFRAEGGLKSDIIDLYAKHFTHEEILGLISFYQTPLGRKTARALPQLTEEMFDIGQQWAAEQAPRVQATLMNRLRKEGFAE
jgi:hypothetical protein